MIDSKNMQIGVIVDKTNASRNSGMVVTAYPEGSYIQEGVDRGIQKTFKKKSKMHKTALANLITLFFG